MHTVNRSTLRHQQRGATLLEVLVAFFVLSFGLLGLSGMQMTALKNNQSALQRSQATMLAYFMMDSMRANRAAAIAGSYNLGTASSNTPVCTAPTAASLVTRDQAEWFTAMRSILGAANSTCGLIACDAAGNCRVRVVWDDTRALSGVTTQFIEVNALL